MNNEIFIKAIELMSQERFEEAIDILNKLKKERDLYDVHNNLGCAHMYNQEYSKALDCFNRALKLIPDDDDYRSVLSENIDNSERIENLIYQIRQDRGSIHANKSRVLDKMGKTKESDKEYDKAIEEGYTLQDIL